MTKLIEFLNKLIEKKFYGSVTILFEGGKILRIKKEETLKL